MTTKEKAELKRLNRKILLNVGKPVTRQQVLRAIQLNHKRK